MSVSPASGSSSRCSSLGSSIGMVMLDRAGPTMLRLMPSGWPASVISVASVTIQLGPSVVTLTSRGRASLIRTTATSRWRVREAPLMMRPSSACTAASEIAASVSKTSHSASARRNTAAGVGFANGNTIVTFSPCCLSATLVGVLESLAG